MSKQKNSNATFNYSCAFKGMKQGFKSLLLCTTLLLTTGCSGLSVLGLDGDNTGQTELSGTNQSFKENQHTHEKTTSRHGSSQNGSLWIWIAPDYRVNLPDPATEYIVERI